MTKDGLFQLVTSQSQSYHELEAQSYRLFRILLTIGAIAIAFTQSELFSQLLSLEIPKKSLELAGGGATTTEFYPAYGVIHLVIAGVIGSIGIVFLFETIFWAGKVLDTPPIAPIFPQNSDDEIGVSITTDSIQRSDIAVWVEANQKSLQLARRRLRNAYESIGLALFLFIFAGTCVSAVYLASPNILLLIDGIIVFIGISGPLAFFYQILSSVDSWKDLKERVWYSVAGFSEQIPTIGSAILIGPLFFLAFVLSFYFGYIYLTTFII